MIPQAFVDDIQTRSDIVEIISGYLPLKRAGRNFKALCPFHGEKTASFLISPQKQIFHCFGCGVGGGVIQFLMLHEKVPFVEAIEMLAKRIGMVVPHQQGRQHKEKSVLYDAVEEAAQFFHYQLTCDERAAPIRDYLKKRGIGDKTITKFRLGFARGNKSLVTYLRKKNFTLEVLEKSSLAIASNGAYRDIFWERIMFPIFDVRSRVVGFGARVWKDEKGAKYINSLESPLYSKRDHLYGLSFSKEEIAKQDAVIVTEGYLDMMMPFMHGVTNIVASLGTALTPEQIRLIRRYTSNIILVFDSDKAGQGATLRALDLLLEHDVTVSIVRLPVGADPDSFVRAKGADAFRALIAQGQDFFDFKLDLMRTAYDVDTIAGKAKIAQALFATIEKLPSEIQKYEYIRKLSGELQIKEEVLIAEFRKDFVAKRKSVAPVFSRGRNEIVPITEKVLVKFMLTNKKAFALVRKNLREDDFSSPLTRSVVAYFLENSFESQEFSLQKILGAIPDKSLSGFISQVLMDEDIPMDKELFKSSLLKLKEKRLKGLREQLRQEISKAETKGDTQKVRRLMDQYTKTKSGALYG